MFLYFLDFFSSINSNFQVFEYITLRAILSIITALLISLILGPFIINKFYINNMSEVIRDDGQTHILVSQELQQWEDFLSCLLC